MSEARANTRRPTMREEDSSDEHCFFDTGASSRSTKETLVSSRLASSEAEDLAFVKSKLRISTSSEAVREVIKLAASALRAEKYKDETRAQELRTVDLDEDEIAELKKSLDLNAGAYAAAGFQMQKIGNNVNQIAKAANSGDRVPAAALEQVARQLARVENALARNAWRDADRSSSLREVL